mmetsp:Transcript_38402/g.99356  ORF Transcript_38402/g.99356 Transcript_38402/m.99356 type:complete len:722 (-) Transcript_38402:193-2358(-)
MAAFALSDGQRETLRALCDTVISRLSEEEVAETLRIPLADVDPEHVKAFCKTRGSDLGVPEAVEAALATHLPADIQRELSILLTAMGTRLGMLVLTGFASSFAALTPEQREQAVTGLRTSAISTKRKAFMSLKSLIALKTMGLDWSKTNPLNHGKEASSIWAALGYEGPAPHAEIEALTKAAGREEFVYTMLNSTISKDTTLTFDVVIVGSGCGGSVVAAQMAQAGKRVLVLDKGPYFKRRDMSSVEGEAFDKMYDRGGLITSEDTGISILSGSCFGGGSTINWACSLRTQDHVKKEWATEYGMPMFADGTFDAALDAVCSRLHVTIDGVVHNGSNSVLLKGCEKLGYEVDTAPQNLADVSWWQGGGFVSCGDRYGNKQTATETWLKDAALAQTPAQFADRCEVESVLHKGGVAQGVKAHIVGADGVTKYSLVVNAPIVVVSCGSIQSPALLLRSKIPDPHKQIGKNLRLHPVTGATGVMPKDHEPVRSWQGAPMTTVSNVVAAGPDNDMYGSKLECPIVHPGITSALMPWKSGAEFKKRMLNYPSTAAIIVLTRDKYGGEVRIDKNGVARVYYKVGDHLVRSLLQGLEKALRLFEAAGAEQIVLPQFDEPVILPPLSDPKGREKVLERIIKETQDIKFPLYKVPLFSAHQMGTCRMGTDRRASVVKPTCEAWECSGLYVIDASCFPTSSGTNPMITTYGIAYMAAQGLVQRQASSLPSRY